MCCCKVLVQLKLKIGETNNKVNFIFQETLTCTLGINQCHLANYELCSPCFFWAFDSFGPLHSKCGDRKKPSPKKVIFCFQAGGGKKIWLAEQAILFTSI